MASLLVKNGKVVTADAEFEADVLVRDREIVSVASHLEPLDDKTEVIDASGLLVLPGGIDAHVHMELPVGGGMESSDDFETGSRAALAGGTTTIIDFVTPERGQSLIEAAELRKKAAEKSRCHTRFHMSVTQWNDRTKDELKQCAENGFTSVKVYMAYKDVIGLDDFSILKVMETAADIGMTVMTHCENGDAVTFLQRKLIGEGKTAPRFHPVSRPPAVEAEAVKRAIMMAGITGCPLYIVHVSTMEAVKEISRAVLGGQTALFAETCPHYLFLDESEYQRPGFDGAAFVMSPPLREKYHQEALWDAIKNGYIQTAATDHCPFHLKGQKERGLNDFTRIPNGAAGVEHRMMLLYRYGVLENKINLRQFVDLTSTQPAKIFGLYPQKGTIAVGSDADLVLWDPEAETVISAKTHHQRCDTTIYEDKKIKGLPHAIILNGTAVTP